MVVEGKVLVTINRESEEQLVPASGGDWVVPQFRVIAQAVVETIDSYADISIVKVYTVLPTQSAEQMLLGMVDGETNIAITGMSPIIEPGSECTSSLLTGCLSLNTERVQDHIESGALGSAQPESAPKSGSGKKEVSMPDNKLQFTRGAAIALLILC